MTSTATEPRTSDSAYNPDAPGSHEVVVVFDAKGESLIECGRHVAVLLGDPETSKAFETLGVASWRMPEEPLRSKVDNNTDLAMRLTIDLTEYGEHGALRGVVPIDLSDEDVRVLGYIAKSLDPGDVRWSEETRAFLMRMREGEVSTADANRILGWIAEGATCDRHPADGATKSAVRRFAEATIGEVTPPLERALSGRS